MVVEAFSALALAGNIIQFVEFGSKLLSLSFTIYHSTSGASGATEEWIKIATHLQHLCDQLSGVPPRIDPRTGLPASEDASLRKLTEDCKAAGDELLGALQRLTSKQSQGRRKWDSFRVALATIWKESDIEAMRRRLESYKSLLTLHLTQQVGVTEK